MRYQRSLCHAPYGVERSSRSLEGGNLCLDHFVAGTRWISQRSEQDIHDQFGASSGRVTFRIVDCHFHAGTLSRPDCPFERFCQFKWRHSAWIG